MNLRTTAVLLLTLIAIGAVVFLTGDIGSQSAPSADESHLLPQLKESDVSQIAISDAQGPRAFIVRSGDRWRLKGVVDAPAATPVVQALLASLSSMRSLGEVQIAGNAQALGLESPALTIGITDVSGRETRLRIGNHTGTGGNVYVRIDDAGHADLVTAATVESLDKPLAEYRDVQLVHARSAEIAQITYTRDDGSTVELQKEGDGWRVVRPFEAPADPGAASDLTFALAGLRATEFVGDAGGDLARFDLDAPRLTVKYCDIPAVTQPSATQPEMKEIRFGRYEDVLKKNLFAMAGEGAPVVKVSAESVRAFEKKPLELRDRKLLAINPATIRRISIALEPISTTQPTVDGSVVIERTGAATTEPSPAPGGPRWVIVGSKPSPADSEKVEGLVRQLTPLRVSRYIESVPTVVNSASVVVTIETDDSKSHVIRLIEPDGPDAFEVQGCYNGLSFEAARTVLDAAKASFAAPPPATEPAVTQPS